MKQPSRKPEKAEIIWFVIAGLLTVAGLSALGIAIAIGFT